MAELKGHKVLQFDLRKDIRGMQRLNPQILLEVAGDCGANTLFSLSGILSREEAEELSLRQTKCRENLAGDYKEVTSQYLLDKHLFTDLERRYEIITVDKDSLIRTLQTLKPGKGTMITMFPKNGPGHFVNVYRREDGGLEILDLQNGVTEDLLTYMDTHDYSIFNIPSVNVKRNREQKGSTKRHRKCAEEGGRRRRRFISRRKRI